jgi:aminoglycoside 6'-N-acetyltransferase
MTITWRCLAEADFPLLGRWLAQPHVNRWWYHETSPEAVARDFGPAVRREEAAEVFLALLDGRPGGLVQRYRLADYPEYLAELAPILDVPAGAVSIDYLIGEPELTGRGIGTDMLRNFLSKLWQDYPDAASVIVPVVAANRPSWRALEKAGLKRVAEGELEPDNPIDDRAHFVYRIDRPAMERSS